MAARWMYDDTFQKQMMGEGTTLEVKQGLAYLAKACLSDPSRTEEQRHPENCCSRSPYRDYLHPGPMGRVVT